MEQDYAGVLSFCNDVRRKLGRKPVNKLRRGQTCDGSRCPIANTINHGARNRVEVDSTQVTFPTFEEGPFAFSNGYEYVAATSATARDFIMAFDEGQLPEFEGEGWVE